MCGGGDLELRSVSGGSVTGAVGHGGGSPFLARCQLTPSPDAFARARPLPPASSRGHSGKHNPVHQSKATGFSCFSLHKRSAEPGNRRLQRGGLISSEEPQKPGRRGNPKHSSINIPPPPPNTPRWILSSSPQLPPYPHLPPTKEVSQRGRLQGRNSKKGISGPFFSNAKPLSTLPRLLRNK